MKIIQTLGISCQSSGRSVSKCMDSRSLVVYYTTKPSIIGSVQKLAAPEAGASWHTYRALAKRSIVLHTSVLSHQCDLSMRHVALNAGLVMLPHRR